MSDIQSIHEFDLEMICDYYAALKRQGPGSAAVTTKALSFVEGLSVVSLVADIGCGTGGQTMTLAQCIPGVITGIDLFPKFIEIFNHNARELGLEERVTGKVGSMDALDFHDGELDLIWSEGAIYNIGFETGLREWRKFLKPGGYIAVSEASWFTDKRPAEIEDFWMSEYPGINTIPAKLAQLQSAGYLPTACFVLPEQCWTDNFYEPQVDHQRSFLQAHTGNRNAKAFIENQIHERELYDKYKQYYGYAFYIGRKL